MLLLGAVGEGGKDRMGWVGWGEGEGRERKKIKLGGVGGDTVQQNPPPQHLTDLFVGGKDRGGADGVCEVKRVEEKGTCGG